MKLRPIVLIPIILFLSCTPEKRTDQPSVIDLEGTWQLISATLIEKGDTTFTDYSKTYTMIKVINRTHFAFLNHDLTKGKDTAVLFAAGGGRYELKGNHYTEHLEYCSDREWESNDFTFTVKIKNDTLIQSGVEKIEGTKVDRTNIEKYIRLKSSKI